MRALCAFACALVALPAIAAPTIQNAWMRPALEGSATADAYADVVTDAPLTLVRVRTPVARSVEIVMHDPRDPASTPTVVDKVALKPGETRFALRGSVLRLREVTATLTSATPVPMTFEFVDGAGKATAVEALVQVRGLMPSQPAK